MANTKSTKKRVIQNRKRNLINTMRRSSMRTAVKKFVTALENGTKKEEILVLFNDAQSQLRRAAGKGVIHKGTAARKVSRLAQQMKAATTKAK